MSTLDIDELAFEKQMFANSDDVTVTEPRTELMSEPNEIDYNNLKIKCKGKKGKEEVCSSAMAYKISWRCKNETG